MRNRAAKFLISLCLLDVFFFVQILSPSLDLHRRSTVFGDSENPCFVKLITHGQMDVAPAIDPAPAAPQGFFYCEISTRVTFVVREFRFTPGHDPPQLPA
jgi:hypothetical protein